MCLGGSCSGGDGNATGNRNGKERYPRSQGREIINSGLSKIRKEKQDIMHRWGILGKEHGLREHTGPRIACYPSGVVNKFLLQLKHDERPRT